jgi:hypothetical protein
MNIVDSVTTIGWRPKTAMKKPLKIPAAMPTPIPARVHNTTDSWADAGSMLDARTTLTREITAPADRSNPPMRITTVSPMAAIASVAAPLAMKLISK